MIVPQGRFQLARLLHRRQETLRAWDAADEYLLTHLAEIRLPDHARIAILNDGFGALAVALHAYRPTAISDSWLSQQATRDNLRRNGLDVANVALLDSLGLPSPGIDCLLIKIPKTLALLEHQLHGLKPRLAPGARVIAAGMVKNLPPTAWKLLERLLGPCTPSLAVKKARLLFVQVNSDLELSANPYPTRYRLEDDELIVTNHANVFSRDSLDIGTRFLLQHLPDRTGYRDLIDLGCGNGIVGVMLARRYPAGRLVFVDESFMALASARENFQTAFADSRDAEFVAGDGLTEFPAESADCVVCNPPFHQQHTVGDQIAWSMFTHAQRVLRSGGELRVIGNRHLNYQLSLGKLFGNCRLVAANPKFSVFSCIKR
ncbi:methyltransferase [Methylomonas sp. UP202]|uniref:methyltransferase n=1 Tax=Methylomonas sp. UP202 TaxID=3040943 RepID=UPI0024794674|nr:methyltransferase [Methylomonas sp. UP202]WGS84477.1 methyltransferase [Methylomonas sp. UP202]